jgi:hypothetical protein
MTSRRKFWVTGLAGLTLTVFTITMLSQLWTLSRPSSISTTIQVKDCDLSRTVAEVLVKDASGDLVASGSAVFVSETVLLTARHMTTEPECMLTVCLSSGTEYKVVRIYAQRDHDTAILVIEPGYKGPVATVDRTPKLTVGDSIVCVGWFQPDLGLKCSTTWGRVAGLDLPPGENSGDMECDITCGPGMSGGGVFHDGRLVGLVSRGVPGFLIAEPVPDFERVLLEEE